MCNASPGLVFFQSVFFKKKAISANPFAGSSDLTNTKRTDPMHYHEKSTDDALRQGCIAQHRLAQQHLYQRYFGRLMGVAMRYAGSRDEAREILNQAFLKIFRSLEQYQCSGPFVAWMAKIVVHTAIDHIRRQKPYKKQMDGAALPEVPIENDVLNHLAVEDLYRLVQQLPQSARTVFSLYVLEGYKHREIAEMLAIDEGTSKWYLSQARQDLQKMIRTHYQTSR